MRGRNPSKLILETRVLLVGCGLCILGAGCTPYAVPLPALSTKKTAEVMSVQEDRDMVTMGAHYLSVEKPSVDWQKARTDATAYCVEWKGMDYAEPVGPTRRECMTYSGTDCIRFAIVGDYQCMR